MTIDDVFAGSGRAHDASITDDQAQPSVVFEVENLDRAKHQVSVWNFKEQDVEGCDGELYSVSLES